jgi:hypothetical protein
MKKDESVLTIVSLSFIKNIYQPKLSPLLKKKLNIRCRFYPTCSNYGIMALEKYGFLQGWIKIVNRIFSCNPANRNSCVDYP